MVLYNLLRFSSWITKFIPVHVAYWLCQLFGGMLFYLKPSLRRQVMYNLTFVMPDASKHRRRRIARKVIRYNFKNYYDLVRLPHLDKSQLWAMIEGMQGLEHLHAAMAQGKGAVVLAVHMGNFTLVPQLVLTLGYQGAVVAEDIKPEKLYSMVNEIRSRFGLQFIRAGSAEVRVIYHLIRNNGILMLAGDRDVTDSGVPVTFFGAPAELPSGPVVLAYRLKCPLIPAYTIRLKNNKSYLVIYPPLELQRTDDRDADIEENMRRAVRMMEQMVLKAPEQWLALLQKIWDKEESKAVPAGETQPAAAPKPSADGPNEANEAKETNGAGSLPETATLDVTPHEERSPSSVR